MNRPQKIKKVYRELRMMLGDKFPAHELLESSALLIGMLEVGILSICFSSLIENDDKQ